MSEHSTGPELVYDDASHEIRSDGVMLAELRLDSRVPLPLAFDQRDALGRKMAAAEELVEVVKMALWSMGRNDNATGDERRDAYEQWLAEARMRYMAETGDAPENSDGYATAAFRTWCGGSHERTLAALRAALKKAGVEP